MNTKKINIDISLNRIGSFKRKTQLTGYAYIDSGFITGKFSRDYDLSRHEIILATAFTFTGCPIAARAEVPNINPWITTGGAYSCSRVLKSTTLNVNSELRSTSNNNQISMKLDILYEGEIENLSSIHNPFQERIFQKCRKHLIGQFDIEFENCDGSTQIAKADSQYYLDIDYDVNPVWRNITIVNSINSEECLQVEQIDLFGNKRNADKSLMEKKIAFN